MEGGPAYACENPARSELSDADLRFSRSVTVTAAEKSAHESVAMWNAIELAKMGHELTLFLGGLVSYCAFQA